METNRKDEIWNECFPKCSTLRETWRLAMGQYAIEYHESKVKNLSLSDVIHQVCVKCGKNFMPHLMKPLTICDKCADEI